MANMALAKGLSLPPGSNVALDRGYADLKEARSLEQVGFVTRLKCNAG